MAGVFGAALGWLMDIGISATPAGRADKEVSKSSGVPRQHYSICHIIRITNLTNHLDLLAPGGGLLRMGKTTMIKKLSLLILAVTLLAGCAPFESYPTQQTSVTTTTSCPAGTQLQSDGMCR